jgi:hypothetical protein
MIDTFNDASSRTGHGKGNVDNLEKLMRTADIFEKQYYRYEPTYNESRYNARPTPVRRSDARPKERYPSERRRRSYTPDPGHSPYIYTPRPSAPIQSTFRRTASNDSMHSAPDYEEVSRRRRHSRALSHSREREPIARRSGEFSPGNWYSHGSFDYTGYVSP